MGCALGLICSQVFFEKPHKRRQCSFSSLRRTLDFQVLRACVRIRWAWRPERANPTCDPQLSGRAASWTATVSSPPPSILPPSIWSEKVSGPPNKADVEGVYAVRSSTWSEEMSRCAEMKAALMRAGTYIEIKFSQIRSASWSRVGAVVVEGRGRAERGR